MISLLLLTLAPCLAATQDEPRKDSSYLRLVEDPEGLQLEIAVRRFLYQREDAEDTVVSLVGVMHVADEAYYDGLQALLDGQDVVLFEQVVEHDPARALTQASALERAQVAATHRRLDTLLREALLFRADTGQRPPSLQALVRGARQARKKARLTRAILDAWDRPITLETVGLQPGWLRVTSLGSDGKPGGEGTAADLVLSERDAGPPRAAGLQQDLADALGLVFQLEGIDYSGAHWRRTDVTLSELQALMKEHGADADGLLSALQGGSMLQSLASGVLKFFGSTAMGRGMLKLVSIEALARAEEIMAHPPGGMAGLFEVLLAQRNKVVVADLRRLLEAEPEQRQVAVFYGAGHMSDLGHQLQQGLGLVEQGVTWMPAVDLRYGDTGLPASQIRFLRRTIQRTLDKQLSAMNSAEGR